MAEENICMQCGRKTICEHFKIQKDCSLTIDEVNEWFKERFLTIDIKQVCANQSCYGNDFLQITDADIEQLKSGKVLYVLDEYGTFIKYVGAGNDSV